MLHARYSHYAAAARLFAHLAARLRRCAARARPAHAILMMMILLITVTPPQRFEVPPRVKRQPHAAPPDVTRRVAATLRMEENDRYMIIHTPRHAPHNKTGVHAHY